MKKKKESISLMDYKTKYRMPIRLIASSCLVSYNKIYHILNGGCPTLKTALSIEWYTKGEVNCLSLLPAKILKELKDNPYFSRK